MRWAGTIAPCFLALLGAGGISTPALSEPETFPPRIVWGGGGTVEIWGVTGIIDEVQPGTTKPCDFSRPCQVTAHDRDIPANEEEILVKTFFDVGTKIAKASAVLVETIDFSHPTDNGTGGQCYPSGGHFSITPENEPHSTLIFDFQGSACRWSTATNATQFIGAWSVDDGSTGAFKGAVGLGDIIIQTPWTANRNVGVFLDGPLHVKTKGSQ
jgi:hypothetical protein